MAMDIKKEVFGCLVQFDIKCWGLGPKIQFIGMS